MAFLLAGCGVGQSHPSQVTDTRVIAVVAEPAEISPGNPVRLEIFVADPKQRGVELLAWSCTPWQGSCLELRGGVSTMAAVVEPSDNGRFYIWRQIPSELGDLAAQAGVDDLDAIVWVLACEPGVCGIIEQARQALSQPRNTPLANELAEELMEPEDWMRELPLEGVSLAARSISLRSDPWGDLNENPQVEQRFRPTSADVEVFSVRAGEPYDLRFYVYDPNGKRVDAYAYTTVGRFQDEQVREESENDAVVHWLIPPDRPATGQVWIVFDDRDGGRAVWEAEVEIE